MASIRSSKCQVAPLSREVSAPGELARRDVGEAPPQLGSSSSLSSTMLAAEGRPMKRRTRPLTGSIQVERRAPIAGSQNRMVEP